MHLLEDLAILERVARARRRLRAIGEQPPAAVGRARQVGGVDVQPGAVGGPQVVAGPEVVRMAERQLGRDVPFGEQALRAVEIRQQRIEQARALRDAGFDGLPFGGRQHERQRIERPGTIGALRVGVDVVGDAVLDDEPARELERAAHRVGRSSARRRSMSGRQCGRIAPWRIVQLVVASQGRRAREPRACHVAITHQTLRRSSVNGNSAFGVSARRCDRLRRVAHSDKSRQAPAFGLERVHREGVVAAAAGMRDVILRSRPSSDSSRCRPDRRSAANAPGSADAARKAAARPCNARRRRTHPPCPSAAAGSAGRCR